MNQTFTSSPLWDHQMPYYPQTTCGSFENNINPYYDPFDPTAPYHQTSFSPSFTTAAVIPAATEQTTILSPEISSSCTGNSGEKSAKPSTAAAARRRSRASKKAPTTLLSTSIANFRAVVQQYTGCRRLASPASFKNRRGPVILSFGRPADRKLSAEEDSGRRCYSDEDRCQNLQELHHHQYPNAEFRQGQGGQQQQRGVSYDNSSHDSYISGVDNDHSCSMLTVDDFEW
ncbi:PREDICTED: uncharacterized protein LOC109165807 [Ipomoea nil]|uniref:uncharacterized protein LOC109165807 n=1 Tax=Ipomoea nil TaxID=35883 RepID=UPI000901AB5D|nr:PREDICTED: uncharacterized protein LOC109165807 [Ipomoea nil]